MVTIEFTAIPDTDEYYEFLVRLLHSFQKESGVEVKLTRMDWGTAWQEFIKISTHGQGAEISQIGSTWVSSLVSMNSLRPIPSHIITKIGGEESFVHSTWASTMTEEDRQVWSIPWNAYTCAIAYRRDLLAQAGVDGTTAFATPFALEETVRKIEALDCVENAWLMPYIPFPFQDIVHTAPSWIWGSGGELMDNRGKKVLFDSPATLNGLNAYFKLMRRLPGTDALGIAECMERLVQGKAAVVLTDTTSILNYLQDDMPEARNIGTASVMGAPWSGGTSLVVWRDAYAYPDRLEAAFKLAEFLTRKSTMLEFGRNINILPARVDALNEFIPAEHLLRPVINQLVSSSRIFRTIPLWRRVEHQFGQELSMIAKTVLEDKDANLDTLLTERMRSLTQRLNLTLE